MKKQIALFESIWPLLLELLWESFILSPADSSNLISSH